MSASSANTAVRCRATERGGRSPGGGVRRREESMLTQLQGTAHTQPQRNTSVQVSPALRTFRCALVLVGPLVCSPRVSSVASRRLQAPAVLPGSRHGPLLPLTLCARAYPNLLRLLAVVVRVCLLLLQRQPQLRGMDVSDCSGHGQRLTVTARQERTTRARRGRPSRNEATDQN